MNASLRALLEGVIDYAGLFPPAKLPLPEALANYQRYRDSDDAWMLGRFVCPAARLKEIPKDVTLSCSAIGRGGETPEAFLAGLDADLAEIAASHVQVEALETKLPPDPEQYQRLLDGVERRLTNRAITVFFEVPWTNPAGVMKLFAALFGRPCCGAKIRTGGLEASAFPSSEQLTFALLNAISSGRPCKATAGLHHPFPRFDASVQARMHGFINVLTASVLVHAEVAPGDIQDIMLAIRQLLDEDDPSHLVFTDTGLRWRDYEASLDKIKEARRSAILSFGSCSFDEPRDDLRALGWL